MEWNLEDHFVCTHDCIIKGSGVWGAVSFTFSPVASSFSPLPRILTVNVLWYATLLNVTNHLSMQAWVLGHMVEKKGRKSEKETRTRILSGRFLLQYIKMPATYGFWKLESITLLYFVSIKSVVVKFLLNDTRRFYTIHWNLCVYVNF